MFAPVIDNTIRNLREIDIDMKFESPAVEREFRRGLQDKLYEKVAEQ